MRMLCLFCIVGFCASATLAQQEQSIFAPPDELAAEPVDESRRLHLEIDTALQRDYVYRGVNYTDVGDGGMNLTGQTILRFDMGEPLPQPFIGLAGNFYTDDPQSDLQFLRPMAGAELALQPMRFALGVQSYLYPDRSSDQSTELFGRAEWDDGSLWNSDSPVLRPYALAAYDVDLNNGWYVELGISHDFEIGHLTLTPIARVAYTRGWQQQFVFVANDGSGWQHFDVGIQVGYKLNSLLNISPHWGAWTVRGELFQTEHLADSTVGQSLTWWGVGLAVEF